MELRRNMVLIEVEEANVVLAQDAMFLSLAEDPEEALRRYHAIAEVMLAQLVGVKDCHVRFVVTPADGVDAVRFWLLPMLRGETQVLSGASHMYQFFPEQHAPSVTFDFAVDEGDLSSYQTVARLNPFCVDCGARYLNMAFLQCSELQNVVGEHYLQVASGVQFDSSKKSVHLPHLPVVNSDAQWQRALQSPIGGKLDRAYKKYT